MRCQADAAFDLNVNSFGSGGFEDAPGAYPAARLAFFRCAGSACTGVSFRIRTIDLRGEPQ
jgi:hypothetical protein